MNIQWHSVRCLSPGGGGREWINECLTTPQHKKQIGYWVTEQGSTKCMKWLSN